MTMRAAATVRELASRIGFTEGPVWTHDGRLLVVSMSRGLILEVDPVARGATVVAEPGGGPNGMAEGPDGAVWIAQNGGRHRASSSKRVALPGIQRWHDSVVTDVATETFTAPNDCAIGPDGRLWFTDPLGSAFRGTSTPGRIWALDPATEEVELVAEGPLFPNGLAFGPYRNDLYVAETRTGRILLYTLTPNGLSAPTAFAKLDRGSPDGLAFDAEGHLLAAAPDADCIVVMDPAGRVTGHIQLEAGSFPTNVCFGGRELSTLFITAAIGGRVFAVESEVPGLPLLQ
jgi:gluconolactonase